MNELVRWACVAALVLAAGATASCTSRVSECVPGEQEACACPGGASGVQVCLDDETFGSCRCDGAGTDSAGSGTSESGGGADSGTATGTGPGSGSGAGPAPGTAATISSGDARLVEVFAAADRILVVLEDEVRVLDLDGGVIASWSAPRTVTAAAFDGTTLAVADTAVLHTLTALVEPLASVELVETCDDLVMVTGPRIVCGPENDWDRIFYTYDAAGTLLATSQPYTYNGRPMRRVPGTDDFVTVSVDLSPSDFHLYELGSNGDATFINESPYHGDFEVTDVYAFQGMPATHVVTDTGVLLRIRGEGCAVSGSLDSQCFLKDGVLGTLGADTVYRGMTTAEDGLRMYALVDSTMVFDVCEEGCTLQRIDLAGKTVTGEQAITLDPEWSVILAAVPTRDAVVLGFNRVPEYYDVPSPGHRVDLIAF